MGSDIIKEARVLVMRIRGIKYKIALELAGKNMTLHFKIFGLVTVGTETLGETCFFLRQRETLFENLKTTHRVNLNKLKAG